VRQASACEYLRRMRLDELRDIIADTDESHWHIIPGGPLFHQQFEVVEFKDESSVTDVQTHHSRAVLRADLSIAIEWGLRTDNYDIESYLWVEGAGFPDSSAHSYYVDMFVGGSLADRETIVSVDGGRAYLPIPNPVSRPGIPSFPGKRKPEDFEWHVKRPEYNLARLMDSLSGHREFDQYFRQSKFVLK
jgi:hypothetical protein